MPKFHVDLGDPPVEKMPPPPPEKLGRARAFESFKSLKQAVRWARYQYQEGIFDTYPPIVDDNGDAVEIDWDSPAWLTHAELVGRLNTAESSRQQHRLNAEKLSEQLARQDNELIAAGLIPLRALTPHIMDVRLEVSPGSIPLFPSDFLLPQPSEVEYTIRLRQFQTKVGKEKHPFVTAMQALTDRMNK